jgi:uncharacterized protein with HEPN domain
MTRGPADRLRDILDAIRRARVADRRLRDADAVDDGEGVEMAFDALMHDLFVIGEAVKAIPEDVLGQEPGVPWREIKGMRDVVGHEYHRIVPAIIHSTVRNSLDPLEEATRRLLASLDGVEDV